jgi:hypothetical protein
VWCVVCVVCFAAGHIQFITFQNAGNSSDFLLVFRSVASSIAVLVAMTLQSEDLMCLVYFVHCFNTVCHTPTYTDVRRDGILYL